jgi:FkbM family methyltransferase
MRLKNKRVIELGLSHPLAMDGRLRFLLRLFLWQLFFKRRKNLVLDRFVNECRLMIKPGLPGCGAYFYLGLPEFKEESFLLHFLREGDLFLDVGAGIGIYTVLASAVRKAHTIAIEPNPASYSLLIENVKLNSIEDRVDALNECAGPENTEILFSDSLGFMSHVVKERDGGAIRVRQRRLDDSLEGKCPVILKTDTEGYEGAIFKGAQKTLADIRLKAVIIELWKRKHLHDKLTALGFELYDYEPFSRQLIKEDSYERNSAIYIRDFSFANERLAGSEKFKVLGRELRDHALIAKTRRN